MLLPTPQTTSIHTNGGSIPWSHTHNTRATHQWAHSAYLCETFPVNPFVAQFLGSAREAALYEAKWSSRCRANGGCYLRTPRVAVSNMNVHKTAAVYLPYGCVTWSLSEKVWDVLPFQLTV